MQQINLYHVSLRKKINRLGFDYLARYSVAALMLLLLISAVQGWIAYSKSSELAELKAEESRLQTNVANLSNRLQAISDDRGLKQQISDYEFRQRNVQNALQVLSGKTFGNLEGFTGHFTGLARQHIDDVWLTTLEIRSGGQQLNLAGSTFVPEQVPRYLQKLSNEQSFRGLEFRTFVMERKEDTPRIDFIIRSEHADESETR